jgi:hypothetical protein
MHGRGTAGSLPPRLKLGGSVGFTLALTPGRMSAHRFLVDVGAPTRPFWDN